MPVTQALTENFGSDYFTKDNLYQAVKEIKEPKQKNHSDFPIDVFPKKIQNIIIESNRCLNFPVDFIGASILASLSISIGLTHKIEVRKEWQETALLYLGIVGDSGSMKTPPLSFALKIIKKKDKTEFKIHKKSKTQHDEDVRLAKGKKEKNIRKTEAWKQILVSDFTPEALCQVHENNERGIAVYADELASWFNNFNRYNSGSEEQFWLTAWNSTQITINRKTSDNIFIENPYIPVLGGIQPKVLKDMSKNARANNGFMDRILFAFPENLKKEYWSDLELDNTIIYDWDNIIEKLLNLELYTDIDGNKTPTILTYTPDSYKIIKNWQEIHTDLMNNTPDDSLKSVYSKFESYIHRFALIIQLSKYGCDELSIQNINSDTAESAIKLVEYFKQNAERVNEIIHTKDEVNYPLNKQNLLKALPDKFATGEGIIIAEKNGMQERTFKEFLSKNIDVLFINTNHGEYEKIK